MDLYLLNRYNNYFNRIIKSEKTITDYLNKSFGYFIQNDVNFYDPDGVTAEHIFNLKREDNIEFVPDYMLEVQDGVILSKWFVIEWRKIRRGQYRAILRADVVSNNIDEVLDAPCFVEKAMLSSGSPFIFNNEAITFNQIKKSETLLKDRTQIGWLVGYYAQDDKTEGKGRKIIGKFDHIEGSDPVIDINDIPSGIYINFGDDNFATFTNSAFAFKFQAELRGQKVPNQDRYTKIKRAFTSYFERNDFALEPGLLDTVDPDMKEVLFDCSNHYVMSELNPSPLFMEEMESVLYRNGTKLFNTFANQFYNSKNYYSDGSVIRDLQNKYIKKTENGVEKTYKLEVQVFADDYKKIIDDTDAAYKDIQDIIKESGSFPDANYTDFKPYKKGFWVTFTGYRYLVKAIPVELALETVEVDLAHTRNHLNDAPYDMFVVPFDLRGTRTVKIKIGDGQIFELNNQMSLAAVRTIMEQLGGTAQNKFIYDVQYLPFCPIEELRNSYDTNNNIFDLTQLNGFEENKDYQIIYRTDGLEVPVLKQVVGFLAWATRSSGTFNIPFEYVVPKDPIEKKVEYETKFMRLCSPNYNGIFEFNPIKNNGIRYFNVDYTYKPFQPYIHMNPDFSGLYGKDFNDNKGLLVGGDFSLPAISDNFINYELNNKNYQEIFNREIKNMDVNYKWQVVSNAVSLGFDTITGAAAGVMGGMIAGGPVGAAIGGVVGGAGTLGGGLGDMAIQKELHQEQKSFKNDMFGYTLGNIKAQPQSISKTTPFTANNKIFPFVEVYDSTPEEKNAFRDKLIYNGMTVMVIGTMRQYITKKRSFFKGQLIRLEDLIDDYHLASEIYNEIEKGVYINVN